MCSFHLKTCLEAVCLFDIQTESDIRLLLFPYIDRMFVFLLGGLHLSSDFVSYSLVSADFYLKSMCTTPEFCDSALISPIF